MTPLNSHGNDGNTDDGVAGKRSKPKRRIIDQPEASKMGKGTIVMAADEKKMRPVFADSDYLVWRAALSPAHPRF